MNDKTPVVINESILKVGTLEIKVLTLDNGLRIIPEDDFKKAIKWLGFDEDEIDEMVEEEFEQNWYFVNYSQRNGGSGYVHH